MKTTPRILLTSILAVGLVFGPAFTRAHDDFGFDDDERGGEVVGTEILHEDVTFTVGSNAPQGVSGKVFLRAYNDHGTTTATLDLQMFGLPMGDFVITATSLANSAVVTQIGSFSLFAEEEDPEWEEDEDEDEDDDEDGDGEEEDDSEDEFDVAAELERVREQLAELKLDLATIKMLLEQVKAQLDAANASTAKSVAARKIKKALRPARSTPVRLANRGDEDTENDDDSEGEDEDPSEDIGEDTFITIGGESDTQFPEGFNALDIGVLTVSTAPTEGKNGNVVPGIVIFTADFAKPTNSTFEATVTVVGSGDTAGVTGTALVRSKVKNKKSLAQRFALSAKGLPANTPVTVTFNDGRMIKARTSRKGMLGLTRLPAGVPAARLHKVEIKTRSTGRPMARAHF